ncbi:unnamed protein product, partial [marine sediment metagenome]
TTYTNFTILSNCAIFNLEPEYYIGDTLSAGLMVFNFSSNSKDYDFEDWDITIVDSDNETTQNNLVDLDSNVNQVSLLINNETFRDVNKIYYLKVNMTELNRGTIRAAYFPINIINSNPTIISEIDLSPDELFRTDECLVSINVTDIETVAENLTITVTIQDSEGRNVIEKDLSYKGDNLFSTTFVILPDRPAGRYKVDITAMD